MNIKNLQLDIFYLHKNYKILQTLYVHKSTFVEIVCRLYIKVLFITSSIVSRVFY